MSFEGDLFSHLSPWEDYNDQIISLDELTGQGVTYEDLPHSYDLFTNSAGCFYSEPRCISSILNPGESSSEVARKIVNQEEGASSSAALEKLPLVPGKASTPVVTDSGHELSQIPPAQQIEHPEKTSLNILATAPNATPTAKKSSSGIQQPSSTKNKKGIPLNGRRKAPQHPELNTSVKGKAPIKRNMQNTERSVEQMSPKKSKPSTVVQDREMAKPSAAVQEMLPKKRNLREKCKIEKERATKRSEKAKDCNLEEAAAKLRLSMIEETIAEVVAAQRRNQETEKEKSGPKETGNFEMSEGQAPEEAEKRPAGEEPSVREGRKVSVASAPKTLDWLRKGLKKNVHVRPPPVVKRRNHVHRVNNVTKVGGKVSQYISARILMTSSNNVSRGYRQGMARHMPAVPTQHIVQALKTGDVREGWDDELKVGRNILCNENLDQGSESEEEEEAEGRENRSELRVAHYEYFDYDKPEPGPSTPPKITNAQSAPKKAPAAASAAGKDPVEKPPCRRSPADKPPSRRAPVGKSPVGMETGRKVGVGGPRGLKVAAMRRKGNEEKEERMVTDAEFHLGPNPVKQRIHLLVLERAASKRAAAENAVAAFSSSSKIRGHSHEIVLGTSKKLAAASVGVGKESRTLPLTSKSANGKSAQGQLNSKERGKKGGKGGKRDDDDNYRPHRLKRDSFLKKRCAEGGRQAKLAASSKINKQIAKELKREKREKKQAKRRQCPVLERQQSSTH